jgi:cytosine/adenosine deaminase-related metal-dependent hydrolase
LEAIDFAARAIAGGEARARVELVYALADASRGEEALREADQPMPDALSTALLRGARAYALNRLGRVEEARRESAAAIDAVRALGIQP